MTAEHENKLIRNWPIVARMAAVWKTWKAWKTSRNELIRNWPIIAVTFMLVFFSFGVPTFSLPFIYEGAIGEFGWTREEATWLATYKFVIGAAAALVMGRLLDRYSANPIVVIAACMGGLGLLGMLWATSLSIYYVNGLLLGVAASGASACMKVVVARVFQRQMGTALGVVFTATSAAGVVVPLVIVPLMGALGWRAALALLSLGVWLVSIPAWLLLFRPGREYARRISVPADHKPRGSVWKHFTVLALQRNFWLIAVSIFLVAAVDQGMTQNHVLFLRMEGITINQAAWGSSLFALMGLVGKVVWGWIYDKRSVRGIQLTYLMLVVAIMLAFPVAGVMSMAVFMSMRGFAHGGLIVDVPVLTKHYYGPQNIGLNMGIMTMIMNLGFAIGPPLLARFADTQGTYDNGFIVYALVALFAAALLIPIRPRFWEPPARRSKPAAQRVPRVRTTAATGTAS